MLPRVRYTGQACLSPLNCERFVLSDVRMTGANTAPFGNLSFNKRCMSERVLLLFEWLSNLLESSTTTLLSTSHHITAYRPPDQQTPAGNCTPSNHEMPDSL